MAAPSTPLRSGSTLDGRFAIERIAGVGGMGSVYRAHSLADGRLVAVKVLDKQGAKEEARFAREVRLLAELDHPAVVRYLGHGFVAEGRPYLAMEWLEGEDLHERLSRGWLSVSEALVLGVRVASALAAAHDLGIVHRDVKPSNLLLEGGSVERVRLLDFGVARWTARYETQAGVVIGTPGYMAPEQARGGVDLDARADVFSLGCVLYECVTGQPAFIGEHIAATLAKVLFAPAPRASEAYDGVPAALDELLSRMLEKDPRDRPGDAHALAAELAAIEPGPSPTRVRRQSVSPASLTGGELRVLSVILAAGSWSHAGQEAPTLTPEEAGAPLGTLLEAAARHGARAEPLADGSLVAVLAAARAATDRAAQAARCALAMRRVAPNTQIALATGRGEVAGNLPVGEAIDRAARMVQKHAAAPGGATRAVRLDDVTAGLLDGRFAIGGDDDGLVLEGEREEASDARTLLGRPTPCLGRDRELSVLEGLLEECTSESVARSALVTGAAGMGKSRIRFEFLKRLRGRAEPVELWIARGDAMGAGSPFGMLAPAVRRAAGLADGEPAAVRSQKLRARVARHLPAADLHRVFEFLSELVSVPCPDEPSVQLRAARDDAVLMGDQMLRAWEDFVIAECTAQPVVLVLEDLHWGDLPTIRFVDAALRRARDAPLLVLAFARPEVHTTFPRLRASIGNIEIALDELSRRAAERLVRAALGPDVAPETVAAVIDRAEGNAFYLEEIIRAVAEGKGGDLPETVLAMVQTRLEALPANARRALRAASIFGRAFWRDGVAALLGATETASGPASDAALAGVLPDLCERELCERRPVSRFPGDEELTFRHGLVREAAYSMLTDADKRLGHRLAGAWLERAGEQDALVLAEHFDRGGDGARAAAWLQRAAVQALEGHDFATAIERAARAIALCPRTAVGAETTAGALHLLQAEAHRWRGELVAAEERSASASKLLPRGSAAWYRAVEEAMNAAGRRGDYMIAEVWQEVATAAVALPGAEGAEISCLCAAARQILHAGRYDEADALAARVQAIHDALAAPEPRASAELYRFRGARARQLGDPAGDVRGYAEALAAYETAGDARNAANACVSLGFAHIECGDFEQAEQHLVRGLADAERMGLAPVAARARQNLALVHAARGDLERARALGREVAETCRASQNLRFEGWTRIYLANFARAAGDFADAEREAAAAAELLSVTPPARAGALAALALARLGAGRVDEARGPAAEAMDELLALGGELEEFGPLVRLAHIEVLAARGALEGARAAARMAVAQLRERAARFGDEASRRRFLEDIALHARLVELASR